MDQVRIGSFLKQLRKEKALTQEQLAERLGVSGRTVSRWENGNNMPDISILVDLADLYDLDIREIINGERKSEDNNMDEKMKDTLVKVAEYTNEEKLRSSKQLLIDSIGCLICLIGVLVSVFFSDIGKNTTGFTLMFVCIALSSMLSVIKNVLRINGNIGKDSFKKLKAIALTVSIAAILAMAVLVFFMVR